MIKNLFNKMEFLISIVIVMLIIVMAFASENFLTVQNLIYQLDAYSGDIIFAMGLLVVLIAGGIDISFMATASASVYVAAKLSLEYNIESPVLAFLIIAAVGIAFGMVNAFFIYNMKMVSIIVTISMQSVIFGLLMYFTDGHLIYDLPDWWVEPTPIITFGSAGNYYSITVPILMLALCVLLNFFILNMTTLGKQVYALGGNTEAAHRIGIKMGTLNYFAYGYMGFMAGIAGFIQSYRNSEINPSALVGKELDILAAVVLGGASLTGGRGTVFGTILGIALIAIIKNGLNLAGVSSYSFDVIIGLCILIAITITHYHERKKKLS